jgi:hypothetical protein
VLAFKSAGGNIHRLTVLHYDSVLIRTTEGD